MGQVPIVAVASIMIATTPNTGERAAGSGSAVSRIPIETSPAIAPAVVLSVLSVEPTFWFIPLPLFSSGINLVLELRYNIIGDKIS